MRTRTIIERFEAMVNKNGPLIVPELGNCWEWTGFRYPTGHGQFYMGGRKDIKAQRAAWILYVGEVPPGGYICHHCDNPSCVRLSHIYCGTAKTNMIDKVNRKRTKYEKCAVAKLDWQKAREIRQEPRGRGMARKVGTKYGVSGATVLRIWNNEQWTIEDDPLNGKTPSTHIQ